MSKVPPRTGSQGRSRSQAQVAIRTFEYADATALGQVMFDAVRVGTANFYDAAQRAAWMPEPRSGAAWLARLQAPKTWVAEDALGIAGFITLATDGHIDLAYVRPDRMGAGVAQALYDVLEKEARACDCVRLYSEASHLAQRFFERQGWQLVATQNVESNGVTMQNHRMEKRLAEKDHDQTTN